MDTNSPVGSTLLSDEHVLLPVSWEEIKSNPVARLHLLKEVREVAGAEKMIPEFYDSLRMIATSSSTEQESLKERLGDMLAALGIELQTSDANQGFSNQRVIPDFPVPVLVQESAVVVPVPTVSVLEESVPPVSLPETTPVEKPGLSLDDIRNGVDRINKEEVGFQRYMEALKNSTSTEVDREYVEARNALLGDLGKTDITELREKFRRFEQAARQLAVKENINPTRVPVVPNPPEASLAAPGAPSWNSLNTSINRVADDMTTFVPDTYQENITPVPETPTPEVPIVHGEPEAPAPAPTPEAVTVLLMADEVTKGLEELLSEWSIFEKSGIFGLGRHGIEHPLYKKLAVLPMDAIINGPLEGLNPKLIATVMGSIKEYVSGWEGDLGIHVDLDETFERYLRRVIATILRIANEQALQAVAA